MKMKKKIMTLILLGFVIISLGACKKRELYIHLARISEGDLGRIENEAFTDYIPDFLANKEIFFNYENKKEINVTKISYHIYKYNKDGLESFYSKRENLDVNPKWTGIGMPFLVPAEAGQYKLSVLIKDEVAAERTFYVIKAEGATAAESIKKADDIWDELIADKDEKNWQVYNGRQIMFNNGILYKSFVEYYNAIFVKGDKDPVTYYKLARAQSQLFPNPTSDVIKSNLLYVLSKVGSDSKYYFYASKRLGGWYQLNSMKCQYTNFPSLVKPNADEAIKYYKQSLSCTNKEVKEEERKEVEKLIKDCGGV